MGHGQRGASLATPRGDDGATGARTHAQPEAVDLRATPVVRLKRTLAHYWLQGRVRKVLRQTPRICGALQCMCRGRDVARRRDPHERRQNHRHKHKEDTTWSGQGQIDLAPDHTRVISITAHGGRAGGGHHWAQLTPCLWTSTRPQRVRLPQGAGAVDNLSLWITCLDRPSVRTQSPEEASYTPSDLRIVDNFAERTGSCHPVDKPVYNLWTTLKICGYPEVVKALAALWTSGSSTG